VRSWCLQYTISGHASFRCTTGYASKSLRASIRWGLPKGIQQLPANLWQSPNFII